MILLGPCTVKIRFRAIVIWNLKVKATILYFNQYKCVNLLNRRGSFNLGMDRTVTDLQLKYLGFFPVTK